jgi:hypothetical protein
MNLPPPLHRSLTIHKMDTSDHIITDMDLKSTTVLIELIHVKDNKWFAHYYEIDEDGGKVLKQKYITGDNAKELKSQFGVSLLST